MNKILNNSAYILLVIVSILLIFINTMYYGANQDKKQLALELYAEKQATQYLWNHYDKYIMVEQTEPFKVTYYHANCKEGYCNTSNRTSTGTTPIPYWTIATDPAVIPPGTLVGIDNHIYRAEDAGVYGNTIDICVSEHDEALALGVYYPIEIYIFKEVKE